MVAEWVTTGLLHGTALAVLTGLAAATLLRRARPALLAALWTVVLLKFLVPIGPRTSLSLSTALDSGLARFSDGSASTAAPAAIAPSGPLPAADTSDIITWVLVVAYLAGLAVIAGRRVRRYRALRRHVRALPLAPADTVAAVAELARGMMRRPPRLPALRLSSDAPSPYLVGCVRPDLVLPAWLDPASPAWAAAMTHELAHLARRDPWLRAVESATCALFFFWPPVAWVCRRIDRAREMACDQWALAHGPLPARDYARFLVELATRGQGRGRIAAGAIALVRPRSQLGARVDELLAGARPPRLGRGRAAVVAGWSALCLAGAAGATDAAIPSGEECALDPGHLAQILATHPDSDADGDGLLSHDEACAHQQRMRQRLLDHVVDADLVSRLDPEADIDGDGALSELEIESIKDQFEVEMASDRGDAVVLHYGGAPIALPDQQVRVAAAASSARVCRTARCAESPLRAGDASARGRFPLLIDVSPFTQE